MVFIGSFANSCSYSLWLANFAFSYEKSQGGLVKTLDYSYLFLDANYTEFFKNSYSIAYPRVGLFFLLTSILLFLETLVQDTFNIESINELRQKYLDFFKDKNHLVYPSASLKSEDPTLLFTSAGMVQFKPYFLGVTPKFAGVEGIWHRVATAQKCLRINDIENVGRTLRHHSFFEMMGNFSFGNYFKKEAAEWAWELLTKQLGFAPEKLYVTVYQDDDEAFDVWEQHVGVSSERISRWGEDENFWPANAVSKGPNGPCGPCSEIFFDRGPEFGTSDEIGPNTGSGDRFIEIWNLVFTQFDRQDNGHLEPLPQKNIDTGLGFERLVAVISGQEDAYATELFQPTIRKVVELSNKPYEGKKSVSHRVIADHIRAVTFIIADGILPANVGEGYVVKMLLRRAARHAYLLGFKEPVLYDLVEQVVEVMGTAYPELEPAKEQVQGIIHTEEKQFLRTLKQGINRVNTILDNLNIEILPGDLAFDLWETYGFPLDLTEEMATERGVKVDKEGYRIAREKAEQISRGEEKSGTIFTSQKDNLGLIAKANGETIFVGYKQMEVEASILALLKKENFVENVKEGEEVNIILDQTPFYAESGGQVADKGTIYWQGGHAKILDTQKSKEGMYSHKAKVIKGNLLASTRAKAVVGLNRFETEKHHSATHLLHAALRIILGNHVAQAGSLVEPERLRFDFSHGSALTRENIEHIEILVNRWIQANFQVSWQNMPIDEARQTGAMMLFGEKYGSIVRVVSIGDSENIVSTEFCGGTHVKHTGNIGSFIIISEEAVSAGMRRIEAVVGEMAVRQMQSARFMDQTIAQQLNVQHSEVVDRIEKLQGELKKYQREASQLRDKLARAQTSELNLNNLKKAAGFSYNTAILKDLDPTALRSAADDLLKKSGADFVVLTSGKLLVTKVSKEALENGIHAGKIVRKLAELAGGGGGGRADIAQAGIKDLNKLPPALEKLPEILGSLVGVS